MHQHTQSSQKKSYEAPKIAELGSVDSLTQGRVYGKGGSDCINVKVPQ